MKRNLKKIEQYLQKAIKVILEIADVSLTQCVSLPVYHYCVSKQKICYSSQVLIKWENLLSHTLEEAGEKLVGMQILSSLEIDYPWYLGFSLPSHVMAYCIQQRERDIQDRFSNCVIAMWSKLAFDAIHHTVGLQLFIWMTVKSGIFYPGS